MLSIDKAIHDTDNVICENISKHAILDRGFISQNILAQLRNLVEYIDMKVYQIDIDPNNYNKRCDAINFIKNQKLKYQLLYNFHELLQKSTSHYTLDPNNSERLMLKYYEYLLKLKIFVYDLFAIDILSNINDFPLNNDTQLLEYYNKISEKIHNPSQAAYEIYTKERYYIQKIKPFFIKDEIFYEITFTPAHDNVSKFDRTIAFTKIDMIDNYAVKFKMHKDTISVLGVKTEIQIIDAWSISIRNCELNHFAFLFSGKSEIKSTNLVIYKELMKFLTLYKVNLLNLILENDEHYDLIKKDIITRARNTSLFDILDNARDFIMNNKDGSNLLRYLLYTMNNKIIKNQLSWKREECQKLSNLYVEYGSIPFDRMPFCTSLRNHNPRIADLLDCIPSENHEDEFLAKKLRNNTEQNGIIFSPLNEIKGFSDLDNLIISHNEKLYHTHHDRDICKFHNFLYIKEYVNDCKSIINVIKELSSNGINQYANSVNSWLSNPANFIDSEEKKNALIQMFENSKVAFIYGSAGTGKTTLVKHISRFFANYNKLFLANTNPAIDNLKRKIQTTNSKFMTISKFVSNKNDETDFDILIIDECSTVSNKDMCKILNKANYKLLILVGDIYQIQSITFGNWFAISKYFIPKTSVFELKDTYRSSDENLKELWKRVRNFEDSIAEFLCNFNYVANIDESVFSKSTTDEIILCLNYDGLYGINNINSVLQSRNSGKAIALGIKNYKVGDPILFNESNRFSPLIYNNMKGKIIDLYEFDDYVQFNIELDISINDLDAECYDFTLLEPSTTSGNSVISFTVKKNPNTDEDNISEEYTVPFQIAYAISIHKAQGLEFDSVKIIISNEVEEQISHNIFYTAITRARKSLKIYWSPEVQQKVLSGFEQIDRKRDVNLLKSFL
ncbi:MAG: ATP-dependent RecD-like DNA helicase [Treponema sp.]|nr:ATP-dependent RecD-like DNA helicase [Treponema sp.]